jgi:hypothetical protein
MRKIQIISKFLPFTALILLAVSAYYIQKEHESYARVYSYTEDLKYLPSGNFLKGAMLSFDEVAADLLWIKAIGYFGEHAKTDHDYTWLHHILDITTTLDPFYSDPYEFGGIVLGAEVGDIDKSIDILKKGIENVPKHNERYWYLPFFTAFNYMYYKRDNLTAAQYLETASHFPKSPAYLPLLVSRLYANTDAPGAALPFLEEMLSQTESPELQVNLENRIKDILNLEHIRLLSTASKEYFNRTGKYPQNIDILVFTGFLKSLPIEPYGGKYFINESGLVQSSSEIDNLELHISKKVQPQVLLKEQQ